MNSPQKEFQKNPRVLEESQDLKKNSGTKKILRDFLGAVITNFQAPRINE
jgi:hypothetical protein